MKFTKEDLLRLKEQFEKAAVPNWDYSPPAIHKFGCPTTVGMLKKMIEGLPDEMLFGFRNQPVQELLLLCYRTGENYICFQEVDDITLCKALKIRINRLWQKEQQKWLLSFYVKLPKMGKEFYREYYSPVFEYHLNQRVTLREVLIVNLVKFTESLKSQEEQ